MREGWKKLFSKFQQVAHAEEDSTSEEKPDPKPTIPITSDRMKVLFRDRSPEDIAFEHKECIDSVKELVDDPHVLYILNEMRELGCALPKFRCTRCIGKGANQGNCIKFTGGYHNSLNQVLLCEDIILYSDMSSRTTKYKEILLHELIHAFDHCRAKINVSNLDHHACTEIRAASLSGECRFKREFSRGSFPFYSTTIFGRMKECVKFHAAESLKINPNLGDEDPMIYVNRQFENCFNDLEPYVERPFRL
mmetsp:Transcript_13921/g.21070  ORF Transcript_13921/g.21070 Transcript_13921/m.21070 type:complete len:250 (-) Transcript_13921:19-768(-)